jgi:Tfp pilus assembly PilM family ATPase
MRTALTHCSGLRSHPATLGVCCDHDAVRLVLFRHGHLEQWATHVYPEHGRPGEPGFTALLQDALAPFARRHARCWVLAPLPSLQVRYLRIPKTAPRHRPATVYWTYRKEHPFDPATTVFDYAEEGELRHRTSPQLLVTAYTVARSEIEQVQAWLRAAGGQVDGIIIPHFAMRNLWQCGWLRDHDASAFLYVGDEASSIQIHVNGEVAFSRVVKTGLRSMLREACDKQVVDNDAACLDALRALTPQPLSSAVEERISPALERLMQQVERSITAYLSRDPAAEIDALHLLGEPAAWPRVLHQISGQLGMRVEPVDMFNSEHVARTTEPPQEPHERVLYGMAAATALACPIQTPNLLDTHIERQVLLSRQRRRMAWTAAAALWLVMVGAAYGLLQFWALRQQHALAQVEARAAEFPEQLTRDVIQQRLVDLEVQQQGARAAVRAMWPAALLQAVTESVPTSIYLSRWQLDVRDEAGESARPARHALHLVGYVIAPEMTDSERQAQLMGWVMTLDGLALVDAVEVQRAGATDDPRRTDFELSVWPASAPRTRGMT